MDLKYYTVKKDGYCQFSAVFPYLKKKEFTLMDMSHGYETCALTQCTQWYSWPTTPP